MGILFTIIILGVIIFVHELGHFLTAKYYKMPVHEFSIGMGPKLISKQIGETAYSIRILPLGGFVNIGGMQYEELPEELTTDENGNEYSEEAKLERLLEIEEVKENNKDGFFTKSPFARFIVLIAGIVMNFITGIIGIYFLLSITNIAPAKYTKPIIGTVMKTSKSYGILQSGDKIIEINNKKINTWLDLNEEIAKINVSVNETEKKEQKKINTVNVPLKFDRDGKIHSENIELTYNDESQVYIIGVQVQPQPLTFVTKLKSSFYTFGRYFTLTFDGLKMLITGKVGINQMTGPVGLPKLVGQAYRSDGLIAMLNIFVLLSINIGLMNLLPIPALDGGRILFIIPEFFGLKVNKKIEEKIHMIGMILLLILMLFIMFNDILKY